MQTRVLLVVEERETGDDALRTWHRKHAVPVRFDPFCGTIEQAVSAAIRKLTEFAELRDESSETRELIYLASPYSDHYEAVRERRFEAACKCAAAMMREGLLVFSPIAYSHSVLQHGLPFEWDFWEAYDRVILSKCDKLVVLMLPGWKESKGVTAEIKIAEELGIPVSYISVDRYL